MRFRVSGAAARAAAVALVVLALASPALAVTKTWTNNNGSGDGRWATATNWSPAGVPTSTDDVEIGVTDQASNYLIVDTAATANSVTVGNAFTNNPTLEVKSGATLTIAAASTVAAGATLYLNNGIVSGAGALTVSGTLNFAGGQLLGSGGLTINSGAALTFTGTISTCYLARNTTNNGTITFGSTNNFYYLYQSATVTNNGLIDFQADEDLWTSGAGPFQISNQSSGIVRKSGGAGTTALKPVVNNASGATIESDSGTLALESGSSSGAFDASTGTVINISGTSYTLNSGATVTGAGKITVNSTLNIATGADVTIPNLQLVGSSSKIDGSGTLRVGTMLQWDGGTMTGGGLTVIQGTATVAIACTNYYCYIDNRQINLGTGSTTTYTPASFALYFYNGGSLNVNTGATLNIQTDQDFVYGGGAQGSISNLGTIQKTSGSGATYFGVPLTSSGTISVTAGDLQFPSSTTINGGTITTGTVSNFDITGSVFTISSAASISGTGNFRVTGGTLRIPTGVTQLIPRFSMTSSSAVVDGGGTLQLSGISTWMGGTMGTATASGGTTEVVSGATLNITGTAYYPSLDQNRQLINNGTINYSSTVHSIYLYNGADITNNGTFDMQTDQGINLSGTGQLFTNNSQFLKSAGTGASGAPISVEFDNAAGATVNVTSGRLNFAGKGTSAGTFTIGTGAFIQITSDYDFAGTPSITGSGTLRVTGHMIVPTGITLAVPNLAFDGGYISGAGTVQLTGAATWTAGTMGHTTYPGGTTVVTATGTLDINTTTYVYLDQGRTLVNNNVINYTPATWGLWMYNGSTLNNAGTFNYDSDIGIGVSGTTNLITSSGTILKDTGTGSPVISVPLNNTGLIQVDTGKLFLGGNGTHTGGDFNGNASGAVGFSGGTHNLDATSTLTGTGGVTVTGGTVNVAGSYNPAKLNVSGGAINFNSNGNTGILTLTNSGTIGGTGTFTILDDSTWTGGTMNGTGTTILDAGQVLTISATTNYCFIDTRTFTNNGTIDYTATTSNWHIYLYQGGTLNNAGTLNITSDQIFYGATTTPVNNSGTINKTGATGTTTFYPTLNNSGNVNVTSGTLSFVGNGTHTGSFTVTSPGAIAFGGGTHTMSGAGAISGTGTLAFTGAAFTSGVGYTVGTLKVTNGTATLNANGSANLLDMTGGTLGGSGTLTLNNGGTWSGGIMSGSGSTVLPAGQTLSVNATGAYPSLDGRTFTNNGTVNYTATTTYFQIYTGAVFNNNDTFNANGNQGIYGFSNGTFNNAAVFTRVSGTGVSSNAVIFNNSGTVTASTGTLAFAGNGTHTGTWSIASGATLYFSGSTHTATAGSITGTGTLGFTGATFTGSIPYTVGTLTITSGIATMNGNGSADAFTMSGGTLGGSGTFTANNGGTWSGGTMSGSGNTVIPATKVLNITAVTYCSLDGRTLSNNGIINYSPPTNIYLQIYNNGVLNNTGALNITSGNYLYGFSGGTVNNSGTITRSGAGTLDFVAILNNSGQLTVSNGTLSMTGGGTHTNGVFTATAPGIIQFGGGTHTLSGTGSMGGTGAFSVTGGTTTVGVSYTLTSLALSNGTISFNTSGSIGTLNFTNGTLGGTGTVSVAEDSTWGGGTMSGSGTTIFAAGKTLTLGASYYASIDGRTVQANGTVNYVAPTYHMQIYNNGALNITGTGSLNVQTDIMIYGYGGGTINNSGTLSRTTGSGNLTQIYPIVNNNGTINVTTGGLAFLGGGSHNGTFNATTPAVFEFQSGTSTFNAPSNLGGTGRYRFTGGTATVNGTWGMPIDITNGTLILNTNGSTSALNMTSSGVLSGTGNVTVTGNSTLGGGTLQSGGTLTLDTGVIVSMAGNYYLTVERSIINNGTINYAPPTYYLQLNGATLTNNGTFDIQTDQILYAFGVSPSFVNNGTLKKSAGAATTQFYAPLSNDGMVQVASGKLYFSNTYVQGSGTTELLNNATLQTATLDINGGSLIGNGTVQGHVTSDMSVSPGPVLGAGKITITGNYTQAASGSLNIDLGGTTPGTQYDQLIVQGTVTLGGDLNVNTINSFLPASGNTFQILTFASRNPANTDFANKNGLSLGSGTNLIPAYSATDLQLTTNTVQADMSIAMSSTPSSVNNGDAFTYNITVTNNGGSNASGVQVNAPLPATVTFTGSSPTICTGAPNLVCSFGNIPNLGNASVTIHVVATASGSAPVNASVSASQFDPNGTNNNASATTIINAHADLSVTVTDSLDPVAAGSSIGYTIVVTNHGPDTASGVNLTVTPSAQLTFSSASAPCGGGFPCAIGSMAPGASVTITSSWSISPTATGTASLGANVSGASPVDLDSSDNTATQTTTIVQEADVQVVKTGPANVPPEQGSTVTYNITVTNNGPSAASSVNLDDPTPNGLTLQSVTGDCNAFPCAIGTMTVNETKNVQVTYAISGAVGTTFTNTATVTSGGDTNATNNSSSVTTTISSCPNVAITAPSSVNGGSANNGASATVIANATYNWSISNGTITGGQGTSSITFTAGAAGNVSLSVTVTSGACASSANASVPIISADIVVTKTGPANVSPVTDSTVTYTINVTNNGPSAAANVTLNDPPVAGLTFVSATGACTAFPCSLGTMNAAATVSVQATYSFTGGAQQTVTNVASAFSSSTPEPNSSNNSGSATTTIAACPAIAISGPSAMEPNSSNTASATPVTGATYNWSITNGTITSGNGTNVIAFTTGNIGTTTLNVTVTAGQCTGNASFSIAVTSTQADVYINKTAPASVASGAQFVYTLTIGNNGPASAETVSFSDSLPSGVTFNSVDSAQCTGGATVTCNAGTLAAGATQTVNITVTAPQGPTSVTNTAQITTSSADPVNVNNTSTTTTTVNAPPVQCPTTAPTLNTPADGDPNVASPVTFSWNAVANATSYELWIGPSAASLALNGTTGGTSMTVTLASGSYAWQVIARGGNQSCNPQPSAVRTFTIPAPVQCPTTAPTLNTPADGDTSVASPVTFSWNAVANATSYELWIGPSAASLALHGTTGGTSLTVTLASGSYAWQVIARGNQSCNPQPSAVRTFTIPAPVQCPATAPALNSPADGTTSSSTSITFSWGSVANATSYELWVGPNAASLALAGTTSGNSLTLNLNPGSSYVWQVVAKGAPSCTPQPSATRTFTIDPEIPPPPCPASAPTLVAPANGANNIASPVSFAWTTVADAAFYELWLARNGDALALNQTTAATSLSLELASGVYQWQVVARGSGQNCTPRPSNIRTFTIPQIDTCAGNAAPTGLAPANGETVSSPVTFSWNGVANAIGYTVRMSRNGGALTDVGTTASTSLTAAVEAGSIEFVVDALFSGCPPVRSAAASFNVAAPPACEGIAQPTAPANGVSTANASVTFQWTGIASATGYRVWMQTGTAAPEVIGETLATSLTRVLEVGTHQWWVQTLYEGCPARESQHFSLTILPAQNCGGRGRPSLDAPANNATTTAASVTFTWSAVPDAIQYELWLAPAGGVPTLIGTTALTSITAEVAPGALEWFVRALFSGCPYTESDHRALTYEPPANCAANARPILVAPAEGERLAAPMVFDWNDVSGATAYELWMSHGNQDPELVATTTASHAGGVQRQLGAGRWFVRARFPQPCTALDSTESRFVVVPQAAACSPLDAPVITAPGQISSGVQARVQWSFVAGASGYVLQLANDPNFASATTVNMGDSRQHQFELENNTNVPLAVYLRVHAVDARCNPANAGPWSDTAIVYILPETGNDASTLIGEPTTVEYTLHLGNEFAGQPFNATPTTSWITVTPSSGVVPAGGINLTVTANTAGLPPGTNIGGVTITTGSAGRVGTNATTVTTPISVNLVSPVTPTPKSTPPPDALIIPAVANASGINSQFQSDVRVSNTSAQVMKYQLTFIPTGDAGISAGRQTTFSIEPGRTVALDDILKTWFGTGTTNAIGTLEVRPLTEVQKSTSSTPVGALANLVTFASSRTFNVTPNGTFGQYIPAIPFANFIGKSAGVLSLQQIAHSAKYRTNLGLVEGSGEAANLMIKIFNAGGQKLTEFPLALNGGQHTQLNGFLSQHGITSLDDGRVEVEVVGGNGKVTAYASVLDNATADPLLVSPVTLTDSGNTRWVVPGVADLSTGAANWQTDMRVFNAGDTAEQLTLSFYSMGGGEPKVATMTLQPGEVKQLDRILANLFGVTQNGGAVHVISADAARLIATARTYNQTTQGTYGQFISAVTPAEAVAVGSRPLQLLQVEESSRYRSNIGLAEVSGKPVTLEISIVPPDAKFTAKVNVTLGPNQFVQIPSMLAGLGLGETYNARVTVRAVAGEGRATAYASVIDAKTNDPTYVPAQ